MAELLRDYARDAPRCLWPSTPVVVGAQSGSQELRVEARCGFTRPVMCCRWLVGAEIVPLQTHL
jgi:hypothetical protein